MMQFKFIPEGFATYRLYADGTMYNEDEFDEIPEWKSDDYSEYTIPYELISYILQEGP